MTWAPRWSTAASEFPLRTASSAAATERAWLTASTFASGGPARRAWLSSWTWPTSTGLIFDADEFL